MRNLPICMRDRWRDLTIVPGTRNVVTPQTSIAETRRHGFYRQFRQLTERAHAQIRQRAHHLRLTTQRFLGRQHAQGLLL